MKTSYPRDLVGYGEHPPHARWPNDARVCVQFVINHEEGGLRMRAASTEARSPPSAYARRRFACSSWGTGIGAIHLAVMFGFYCVTSIGVTR